MATYLSQLMQQTGIALSSNPPWQGGGDVSDIFGEDSGAEAVPPLEEQREVVLPQPVQPLRDETATRQTIPDTPTTQPSRVLETAPQVPEVPPVVQSPARGERSIPTESEANPNSETQLIPELTIVEQVEIQSSTANVSPAVAPQAQKAARPNLEPPTKVNQTTITADNRLEKKEARPNLEPPTKANQATVTADNLLEKVETVERAAAMPTPQAYWQVVRDWIAGPPTVIEQVREVVVEQPTQSTLPFPQEEATEPLISQNQPPSPLRLEQISDAQTQQPNLQQDFVLSIGSINLTIAEPPPQNNPPPIVPPQTAPPPDVEPFRLSRHYLRFR